MAKSRQPKETGLPVIIALVFFIVSTIGLGVFVYVLFSDQEAKDAEVVKAKKEVTDMRALVKDAELIARIHRIYAGLEEGTGDQSDLIIVQNEVKEGTKPYQELQKLNAAAKKKGPELAAATATKFDEALAAYVKAVAAGGMAPPKIDTTTFIKADDFDIWPADMDDKKQLKAPKGNLLGVAVTARILRDVAIKAAAEDRVAWDKSVVSNNAVGKAYEAAKKAFNDKAAELPKSFEAKIAELNKAIDALRDTYRRNEAATRAELVKKDEQIDALKLEIRTRVAEIGALTENLRVLNFKKPKEDPFAYDAPLGKITARLADNIVEINLGSNAKVQTGLTFTVLPNDFPEKGRVSRMRKVRHPDDRGNFIETEMFVPKATIEVIEVLGPEVSRARITSEYNDVRDRALPGDLLYNTVWRKGQVDHIALIGIFDINGDGSDDIDLVVRDFTKMGIPVDAYFDLKTKKWIGKLNERTRYVVNGYTPIPTPNDPNLDAKTKMIGAMKAARDEATSKQIMVVPAREFFNRTGFKAKVGVSEDRINQAATKYFGGIGVEMPPPQ